MTYLTNLADVARRTGYPVTEVAGWKSRGHGPQPSVQGVVCHHTAGRNDMHVVRDGRPGLTGPLSQFWLRHDGHIFVIAAGRCWHNAPSTSNYHRNDTSLGIEAENNGSEPWPAKQVDAYQRLCAELCRAFKLPASRVKGHKEVNTQKPDPHSINMNTFRARVDLLLKGEDMSVTESDAKKIANAVFDRFTHVVPADVWAAREGILAEGQKIDPRTAFRQIWAYGKANYATLAAQNATIRELASAVAQREGHIDVDALVSRIEAAIQRVTVRLEVDSE